MVQVVKDLCVRCTTAVPHEEDKSGHLRSTMVKPKGRMSWVDPYFCRSMPEIETHCQGEGRGFESRHPLQRRPVQSVFLGRWPDALSRMWAAARGTSPMTLLNQRHYVATAMLSRPAR